MIAGMRSHVASARAVAALAAWLLCLLVVAGCGGRPDSPEEVYLEVKRLNSQGRTAAIWDLMTEEARQQFRTEMAAMKDALAHNPDTEKLARQFNVSREEFVRLTPEELFVRENAGRERWLDGAEIVEVREDPRHPEIMIVTVEKQDGTRAEVRTQEVEDGWGLVSFRQL